MSEATVKRAGKLAKLVESDPDTAAKLRGMLYEVRKQAVKNPEGANQHKEVIGQNDLKPPTDTAKEIAKETGVSEKTIRRDAKFAAALAKKKMTIADIAKNNSANLAI